MSMLAWLSISTSTRYAILPFLNGPSIGWVDYQKTFDHVFCVIRNVFPVIFVKYPIAVADLLEKLGLVLVQKWRIPNQQNKNHNTDAPKIYTLIVWQVFQNFRGNISGSAYTARQRLGSVNTSRKPKVSDLDRRMIKVVQ